MSVLDLVKLSQALQEKWGVSAAGDGRWHDARRWRCRRRGCPAAEEQTEFDVMLTEIRREQDQRDQGGRE